MLSHCFRISRNETRESPKEKSPIINQGKWMWKTLISEALCFAHPKKFFSGFGRRYFCCHCASRRKALLAAHQAEYHFPHPLPHTPKHFAPLIPKIIFNPVWACQANSLCMVFFRVIVPGMVFVFQGKLVSGSSISHQNVRIAIWFRTHPVRNCASDFPAFPGSVRSFSAPKKSRFFQKISQTHWLYHMSEKQLRGFLTTSIFKKTTSPHPIFRIWACPAS